MHRRLLVYGIGDLGIKFMLDKKLQEIFDKYNKKNGGNWLAGNFIPPEEKEKYKIMFIGQKPSDYFLKPQSKHLRYLGNYNATFIDVGFQCFLKKHNLGKVYVTDMVKREGKAKVKPKKFKEEWYSNDNFRKCLKEEIECYNPQIVVLMGGNVETLFRKNLKELNVELSKIYYSSLRDISFYHPSYLGRSPHATVKWDEQFEGIVKRLK